MALSREECIEYLETLKNFACLHTSCCKQTHEEIREDKKLFNECINHFQQLIVEHFDNPPLKFEELKGMIGKPVYHAGIERWFVIEDVIKNVHNQKLIKIQHYTVTILFFEKGCFFRKEVSSNEITN